jgi:GNAT superfamily N-acetyltransferase
MTDERIKTIAIQSSKYQAVERLRDGTEIFVRAIRADDRDSLRTQFVRLSPESVRLRFHGLRRSPSESEAMYLTEIDFVEHVALVATLASRPEQIIGVGRYIVCGDRPGKHRAEVAFLVLDERQGRGIGSLLLQHLAIIARAQGVSEFQADVLVDNSRMLGVFERSGFPIRRSTEFGVVQLILNISAQQAQAD